MKTQALHVKKSSLSPLNPLISALKTFKKRYASEGFELVGLFGSYARNSEDDFSDIDIAYKINHEKFYKDNAFKKLIRMEEIKKELEMSLKKRVDIVSLNSNNKNFTDSIKKEMVFI